MNEEEIIRKAMTILGGRTSAKKKISSRLNALKPRKKRGKRRKTANQEADHNAQRRIKRRRESVAA